MVSINTAIYKKNITKNIRKFLLYLFCFVYIYTPPIAALHIQVDLFIYIVFLISVIFNQKSFVKITNIPMEKDILFISFLLLSFSMVMTIFSKSTNVPLMSTYPVVILRFLIETVVFSYIFVLLYKSVYGKSDIVEFLLRIAIIQGYFAVFMFFIPSIKEFIFFEFLHFSKTNKMMNPGIYLQRGFGIGSEYIFAMPIFQSLMTCFYIEKNKKKNLIFFINLFGLLISVVFNSRTSLVLLLLYFLYKIFEEMKKTYNLSNNPWLPFVFIVLIIAVPMLFNYLYSNFYEKNESVKFLLKIFTGEYSDGFQLLFKKFLFLPEKAINLFFGNGDYVFFSKRNSDIGYMGDLFFGGFFFVSIKILFFILIYIAVNKYLDNSLNTKIMKFFLISLLVIHYKSDVFCANDFMKGFFIIYYGQFLNKKEILVHE